MNPVGSSSDQTQNVNGGFIHFQFTGGWALEVSRLYVTGDSVGKGGCEHGITDKG